MQPVFVLILITSITVQPTTGEAYQHRAFAMHDFSSKDSCVAAGKMVEDEHTKAICTVK